MVTTRSTTDEMRAFNRLLDEFCKVPAGSPARLLIDEEGITTVQEFVLVPDQFFLDMRYDEVITDDAGATTTRNRPMQLVIRYSLIWLKCYLTYLIIENRMDFSAEELNDLELRQFVIFRSSYSEVPKLIMPTTPNPSHSSSAGTNNPVDAFKKGIKCETSQYPVLKDVCFFDKFEMEFMTLARVHDIEEVFDTKYVPATQAEKDLFNEKQKFAMSVLVHSIKTDVGITLVRKFYKDCKAQEYWCKIREEATRSTRADLELMMLQDKLFSTRIDTNWHGDLEGFLLYWNGLLVKIE